MRRLLLALLFSAFILLSYTSASVVGGRGGGRSRPGGHQDESEGSEAEAPLGAKLSQISTDESRLPTSMFQSLHSNAHLGDSSSLVPSSASVPDTSSTRRLFPTAKKETSTATSSSITSPFAKETRPSEDVHQTPTKPNVQTPFDTAAAAAAAAKNTTPVYRLGAVFEPEHIQSLSSVFFQSLQEQNRLISGSYRLEGVAIETPALTVNALKGACETLKFESVSVGVAVGVTQSIYASGTLASLAGVPLIARSIKGYRDDTLKTLLPDLVVANPRLSDLWEAATSFISALEWCQPILIHDDSPQALQLAHIASRDDTYETMGLSLSANLPRHHFQNRLGGILHTVRRLIFVSGTVNFVKVVFSHGEDLDMFNGEYIWILLDVPLPGNLSESLRPGLLSLRPDFLRTPKKQLLINFVKSSISVISEFFKETTVASSALLATSAPVQCQVPYRNLSTSQSELHRQLKEKLTSSRISQRSLPGLTPFFYVENLVPKKTGVGAQWTRVGYVNGTEVQINAIFWPGRGYKGVSEQNKRLRVALAEAPPFVMTSALIENATCLLGVVCLRVFSPEVAATFADMERDVVNASRGYEVVCCSGLAVDLMINVATDLEIEIQVYLVMDGTFGAPRSSGWTGVVGDLLDGSADLSFAPLSVTAQRARHLDFSDPYFFSSMSMLSSTKQMEVPLLAFLVPFSPDLWIAIFVSLNITAFSVAAYEWLSPFGLNPWGRQRSKNFSYGSALWVIWGLLFSHLVAFKAPKSWPNKVLINVWGAFSVIFVASYTANIAALFAGLFQTRYLHEKKVLSQRVGAVRASSAEYYVSKLDPELWAHMRPNLVENFTQGLHNLHTGVLDLMVGDSAVLDYLRANDPGCTLATYGESLVSDTFSIAMGKGFPLRVKINTILARYLASGHLDHLKHKWYGELPCFRISADIYKPQALEISTVGGVFLMLTLGIGIGFFLLILEHVVYRYALPSLRTKPKESLWRNRNLMFFSQKLYKFINCVELVSPHHSAKELVNNLRTGQIMGLFQKSVKRKENEQRRRRKSKAQFFEMIQEIRRVQKAEKEEDVPVSVTTTTTGDSKKRCSTPLNVPEVTPAPPSPFSNITASSPAPITINYIPGPDPHEDSEGIIVVNSSLPLDSDPQVGQGLLCEEEIREEDYSSGIIILRVSDPEEVLEANNLNQQLEDTQAYRVAAEASAREFEMCLCSSQEGESNSRKTSGGCLNCLQRQDSTRQARRAVEGSCFPCSGASSVRESTLGDPYSVIAGTANGLRHRGSVSNPMMQLPSPALQITTAPSPGFTLSSEIHDDVLWSTRSLDNMDNIASRAMGEESYEGVRLVPLSQQAALRSSGSLQLVATLSPAGRERVNSDHLRHVTKADLWQLWQDSEKELRARLRQAESQRDALLRQLSTLPHRKHQVQPEVPSEKWVKRSLGNMVGDTAVGAIELCDSRKHNLIVGDTRLAIGGGRWGEEKNNGHRQRLSRMNNRERKMEEVRLKTNKGDVSTTPKRRKRQRSRSQDHLDTKKSQDSSEEGIHYPSPEERLSYPKYTRRRKRETSQDRKRGSDDLDVTPKHRAKTHHLSGTVIERTGPAESISGYCTTPLPLLHSLHQHTKSDVERSYGSHKSISLDRREERIPFENYSEQIHIQSYCSGDSRGIGCDDDMRLDDHCDEADCHKKLEDDKLPPRRRRTPYHLVSGYTESQHRRPKERHSSRELPEGRLR
ncbi:uncharacterized protein [Procambarus clarkii]|uniref:uncharacterized protein isoform X1 n=1 Tax=Procambarus clarkii TaxID=6728 RepID=UPI0037444635